MKAPHRITIHPLSSPGVTITNVTDNAKFSLNNFGGIASQQQPTEKAESS